MKGEVKIQINTTEGYEAEISNVKGDTVTLTLTKKACGCGCKKENPLPKSWDEYETTHDIPSMRQYDDALDALYKLLLLRDEYNGGWKPDWGNDGEAKYVIQLYRKTFDTNFFYIIPQALYFKSKDLCDKFFKNFRHLIEQLKPLYTI